jgi:hypothetical protein
VAASSSGLLVPLLSAPRVTDSLRRPAAVAAHTPAMALPRLSPRVTPSIRRRGAEPRSARTPATAAPLPSAGLSDDVRRWAAASPWSACSIRRLGTEAVATGCVPGWAAAIADAAGMAVPLGGGSVSDRVRGWGTAGGTRVGGCEMAGRD